MSSIINVAAVVCFALAVDAEVQCTDSQQCQNQAITDAQVACSGYESCNAASIVSNDEATGYVNCTAMFACSAATNLEAARNLYCSGYKSCYSAQTQSARIVQCSGNSACDKSMVPSSTISADTLLYCGAKGACTAARLYAGKRVYCEGLESCVDGKIDAGEFVYCDGTESCSRNEISTQTVVLCGGRGSCRGATVSASKLLLYGLDSGAESTINGVSEIEALGFQSLQNARIDSELNNITVKVFGNDAGRNALVVCRSGARCNLICKGNACGNLEFRCLPGSTCDLNPSGCVSADNSVASFKGITCPLQSDGTRVAPLVNQAEKEDDAEEEEDEGVIRPNIIGLSADYEVSVALKTCDTASSCAGLTISGEEDVGCKALQSCDGATITTLGLTSLETIGCYGESSCVNGRFVNAAGYVSCHGHGSCQFSTLDSKHVRCSGLEACQNVDSIAVESVMECAGTASCKSLSITNPAIVECLANRACYRATIDTLHGSIVCDGHYSCSGGTLTTGQHTECNGKGSCNEAVIHAVNRVFLNGHYSGQGAQIKAQVVRAYGYHSMVFSTIDSEDHPELVVHAFGHMAGYGATVICRSTKTCSLVCKGSGCKNLDFVCLEGADCTVNPVKCGDGSVDVFKGIDCPTMSTALIPGDEAMILKRKKYLRQNDEIYKKYHKEIQQDEAQFNSLSVYEDDSGDDDEDDSGDQGENDDGDDSQEEELLFFAGSNSLVNALKGKSVISTDVQIFLAVVALVVFGYAGYLCYKLKFEHADQYYMPLK
mmetsp:Transcript_40744/g.65446  ORF Transcript_40744/g.65446 Transcript_40744/m.65446 type:complete len:774 (+) Transcript_40744:42-2363(+)